MNIKESVDLIESYLDLDRKPVGIKFFFNKEEFLSFEVPQRERKVTYCNSVQLASIGKSMKLNGANQGCPNGAFAMKFIDIPTPIASGKGRYNKGMYKNEEISKTEYLWSFWLPSDKPKKRWPTKSKRFYGKSEWQKKWTTKLWSQKTTSKQNKKAKTR